MSKLECRKNDEVRMTNPVWRRDPRRAPTTRSAAARSEAQQSGYAHFRRVYYSNPPARQSGSSSVLGSGSQKLAIRPIQ